MALPLTPGRRQRSNNYFNPGVQGRKTGITLKDTGIRDENGMELLDNIFSSPEKSPVRKSPAKSPLRRNVNRENLALGTSEEMEIQQSSFPGPFEALSARRLVQNEKTKLLPPSRMRSPIKTHLGSSPRRQSSVAPASPQRDAAGTPFRGLTESAVTRRLDFDMDVPVASVERDTAVAKGSNENQLGDKRQSLYSMEQDSPLGSVAKRTHDLAVTVDAFYEDGETNIPIDGVQNDNGEVSHAGGFADEISEDTKPKWHDQTEVYPVEATALSSVDHNPIAAEMDDLDSTLAPQKRKRGQSNASASELPASKRASNPSIPTKERSAALSYYEPHDDPVSAYEMTGYGEDSDVSVYEPEPEPEPKQPEKRDVRGKLHVHVDDDSAVDVTEGPVTARPKKAASKARKPTHKQPPKRNPSKVPARTSARPESVGPQPGQRQPSKPRSLQILRAGTPSEEDTTFRTRSGRQSVQPVNWWKGERVERSFDGTIKEIIRAEDVQVEQRPVKRVRGHRNVSVLPEVEEEEEDDEPDEWELNGGMLRTMVAQYDPDTKTGNEESLYEHDTAYAPSGVVMREVMGAQFSYAKLFTLPWFGSGIVEIPPGGFKRAKNSKKMQMVFFVHTGRIFATVADTEFSIGKGGIFVVPRGNLYSIDNRGKTNARVFFAQGCEAEQSVERLESVIDPRLEEMSSESRAKKSKSGTKRER